MKRWLWLLLLPLPAFGQSTLVTGTVTDTTGAAQANCTYTATLVNSGGVTPTINGSPVTTPLTGSCDGSGNISQSVADNQLVKPTGTKWQWIVVAATAAPQFVVTFSVSGSAYSATQFTSAMPPVSSLNYQPYLGAPSTPCSQLQTAENISNGDYYDCLSGTWLKVTGGGGGGTTVNNKAAIAHQWLNSFTAPNLTSSQPACGDLSNAGTACQAVAPATIASVAHNFLTSFTSTTGAFTQAQPACGDLSNSGTACQAVAPATISAVAHNFLTSFTSGTGAYTQAQPAFTDISGSATAAQLPTATSGAKGIVQGDGSTLTISAGVISCTTATTGQLGCVKPDGTTITITSGVISAVSGGSGTVTVVGSGNLTSTALVTGGGSQTIQTPSATATMDASGNISTPGSVAVAGDGTHAGIVELVGNTTAPAIATNSFGWIGPNSASFTKYVLQPSSTAPAATGPMVVGAVSSNVSQVTYGTTSGTGTVYCLATSCAMTTPNIGAATATSVNGLTITTSTGTLSIANGKTATVNNSLTFAGTDSTTMTFPGTSDTVVTLGATQTLTNKTLTTAALGSSTATTQSQGDNSTKVATTAYTDLAVANAVAGVNPAVAVVAASTTSLTGTYANGAAGIGATFTITTTGAFTLDGVSISTIGQRVLLKNQSSAFQNGVYTATIVGTTGVQPVFTRALDYDTPSEMNSTGAVPVQSGTANTTTSWLLTSTVNTIGADALTYVQFSLAPSSLVTASSPGVGLCHFAGSTQACTSSAVALGSADVSGTLGTSNGGTGNTALTFPAGTATITQTVASGTSAMGTGAITSGTCATVVTTTATGAATTDVIIATPNADPTGVTGYAVSASGSLYIQGYPSSGNVNFKVCNPTSGSLTPGALTLNWRVVR